MIGGQPDTYITLPVLACDGRRDAADVTLVCVVFGFDSLLDLTFGPEDAAVAELMLLALACIEEYLALWDTAEDALTLLLIEVDGMLLTTVALDIDLLLTTIPLDIDLLLTTVPLDIDCLPTPILTEADGDMIFEFDDLYTVPNAVDVDSVHMVDAADTAGLELDTAFMEPLYGTSVLLFVMIVLEC